VKAYADISSEFEQKAKLILRSKQVLGQVYLFSSHWIADSRTIFGLSFSKNTRSPLRNRLAYSSVIFGLFWRKTSVSETGHRHLAGYRR
jgi:hypothetical protein